MVGKDDNGIVNVVHPICCGLDVHKEKLSASLIMSSMFGGQRVEVEEFGTFTDDLIRMRNWLCEHDCPIVAMESTGIYWRPVHNVLEGYMEVILVNARHIKNVPGRKTDICDSKWLAGLLRHGLLKGSFIPPREVREWRELTRLRRTYVESLADFKRRDHKLFESANIKIDSNTCYIRDQWRVSFCGESDRHGTSRTKENPRRLFVARQALLQIPNLFVRVLNVFHAAPPVPVRL
ncbi:MAG: transposase [Thermodesulfobacteriota bacterium]|nr:transposase [Thermodesulfobacteriota bacterium]